MDEEESQSQRTECSTTSQNNKTGESQIKERSPPPLAKSTLEKDQHIRFLSHVVQERFLQPNCSKGNSYNLRLSDKEDVNSSEPEEDLRIKPQANNCAKQDFPKLVPETRLCTEKSFPGFSPYPPIISLSSLAQLTSTSISPSPSPVVGLDTPQPLKNQEPPQPLHSTPAQPLLKSPSPQPLTPPSSPPHQPKLDITTSPPTPPPHHQPLIRAPTPPPQHQTLKPSPLLNQQQQQHGAKPSCSGSHLAATWHQDTCNDNNNSNRQYQDPQRIYADDLSITDMDNDKGEEGIVIFMYVYRLFTSCICVK